MDGFRLRDLLNLFLSASAAGGCDKCGEVLGIASMQQLHVHTT